VGGENAACQRSFIRNRLWTNLSHRTSSGGRPPCRHLRGMAYELISRYCTTRNAIDPSWRPPITRTASFRQLVLKPPPTCLQMQGWRTPNDDGRNGQHIASRFKVANLSSSITPPSLQPFMIGHQYMNHPFSLGVETQQPPSNQGAPYSLERALSVQRIDFQNGGSYQQCVTSDEDSKNIASRNSEYCTT
jgi:hypothetical protein